MPSLGYSKRRRERYAKDIEYRKKRLADLTENKMKLDHIDHAILRFLFQYGGWAIANQVSATLGISWITADKHLKKLFKLGYVVKGRGVKATYWRANG